MKYEKFLKLPAPPYPLPSPRYHGHFRTLEKQYLNAILLGDMADECILIRSQMYQLFRASKRDTSASTLTRDLDLFSLGAVRLARSLRTRNNLHFQQMQDPEDKVQVPPEKDEYDRPPPPEDPIRSSENTEDHFLIKNPLVLSDLAHDRIKPILFPEQALFPGPGRPSIDLYAVLEGVLYKFLADIPWYELPHNYPNHNTCYHYYRTWKHSKQLPGIMVILIVVQIDMEYTELKEFEAVLPEFFKRPYPENSPDKSPE